MLIKRERNKNVFFKTLRFPNHYFFSSTPVLLPGKSHGQRSLVGCSPWGLVELDTTEQLHFHFHHGRRWEWKWKSLSCVRLFATPWTIILQARILEWVSISFSSGSSQPKDWTQVSALQADSLPAEPQGKPKNTGVGSQSLLQGIFPTQESNQGLLHCRRILYQLSPADKNANFFFQYLFTDFSCLESPMDRGAWWATVHGITKSRVQLSDWKSAFIYLAASSQHMESVAVVRRLCICSVRA